MLVLLLLASGCSTVAHRYHYQPPVPVMEADWQACHASADREARRRYDRYTQMVELAGPFGGPFGGTSLARRAQEEREEVYEAELRDCLTTRGYDLRPSPPSR